MTVLFSREFVHLIESRNMLFYLYTDIATDDMEQDPFEKSSGKAKAQNSGELLQS